MSIILRIKLERKATEDGKSDGESPSNEEDWELSEVVFVEDKQNLSLGKVLKVNSSRSQEQVQDVHYLQWWTSSFCKAVSVTYVRS